MGRAIMIGGMDRAATALRDAAGLPLLNDDVPTQAWMTDCLDQVIATRRGAILMSPHGAGKTVALRRTLSRFEKQEFGRREEHEYQYPPRRVVALTTVTAINAQELFIELYRAAFGRRPELRVYRRTKTNDELREDLIARCEEENVVAFVIDEAQTLTDPALNALRDLMAVAESTTEDLIEQTPTGDLIRPAGIGVLLVATMAFETRLLELEEYGRRWIRVERVSALEEGNVPDILTRILPAFAMGAKDIGEKGWAALIAREVTKGQRVTIGILHDVTRTYIRRAAAENPKARKVSDITWDVDLFKQAVEEHVGFEILGQDAA